MTHGFPSVSNPIFTSKSEFPVENRPGHATVDMIAKLKKHLDTNDLIDALSDFHLLIFLHDSNLIEKVLKQIFNLQEDFKLILEIVKTRSTDSLSALLSRPSWQNFMAILSASSGSHQSSSTSQGKTSWSCRHCTYVNMGTDCGKFWQI